MAIKPRIGLTTRLELETNRFYLGRDYSEVLEALGGVPVHLGLIPKKEYIREALKGLDGILLPGSDTDVDPLRFGEEPHTKLKKIIWEKEETDLLVLAEAERLNLPVLAICFGMQVLNVYRGGTLIQDIDSQVPDSVKHEQGVPLARNSHSITIEKGSLLYNLAGLGKGLVNSHHHQAISKLGRDLKASALAKDGVVECIEESRQGRFNFGVQWHPELSWKTDDLSNAIFQVFIKECIRYRRLRS